MAGATAFFTTFALPPILIILLEAFSLIVDPRKIGHQLFHDLSNTIGKESMTQTVETLIGFRRLAQTWYYSIGGFIFMLFVATTLFMIIKHSLNQVWKITIVKKENFWVKMKGRLLSILIILAAGLLFLSSLFVQAIQAYMGKYILELSPILAYYFNDLVNYLLSIIIVTIWFAVLFHYLPDGRPTWSVAFTGAFLTSILFNIGKFILHALLTYSNINMIYRASGSIVLLLLFVFYSSLILYYGAAFTKVWSEYRKEPITPLKNAAHYRLAEVKE